MNAWLEQHKVQQEYTLADAAVRRAEMALAKARKRRERAWDALQRSMPKPASCPETRSS